MKEKHIVGNESKRIFYEELEEYARGKIREHLQNLLEQEVTEWLGGRRASAKGMLWNSPGTATVTASRGGSR